MKFETVGERVSGHDITLMDFVNIYLIVYKDISPSWNLIKTLRILWYFSLSDFNHVTCDCFSHLYCSDSVNFLKKYRNKNFWN